MANHWGQFSEEEMYGNNVGRHRHVESEHPSENLFMQQISSNNFGHHRSEPLLENLSNQQMSSFRNLMYPGSEQFSENLLDQQTSSNMLGNQMHVGSDHFTGEMYNRQNSGFSVGNTIYAGSEHFSENLLELQASGYTLDNQMHAESEHFNEEMFNQQASGQYAGNQVHVESVFNQSAVNYFAGNRIVDFEHFPEEIEARFSQMWADVATVQQNMLLEQNHPDFFVNTTVWSTMAPTERRKEGLRAVVDTIVDQTKMLVEVHCSILTVLA